MLRLRDAAEYTFEELQAELNGFLSAPDYSPYSKRTLAKAQTYVMVLFDFLELRARGYLSGARTPQDDAELIDVLDFALDFLFIALNGKSHQALCVEQAQSDGLRDFRPLVALIVQCDDFRVVLPAVRLIYVVFEALDPRSYEQIEAWLAVQDSPSQLSAYGVGQLQTLFAPELLSPQCLASRQ